MAIDPADPAAVIELLNAPKLGWDAMLKQRVSEQDPTQ
jgi:hypothetical protein